MKKIKSADLKLPTRKIASLSYNHTTKKYAYSEFCCLCKDCAVGQIDKCEKIPVFQVFGPGNTAQDSDTDESSLAEEENPTHPEEELDIFPEPLAPSERQAALASEKVLKPKVPYSIGEMENLISCLKLEASMNVSVSGPRIYEELGESPRSEIHKKALKAIDSTKDTFAFIKFLKRPAGPGHFMAIEINCTERIQSKKNLKFRNFTNI